MIDFQVINKNTLKKLTNDLIFNNQLPYICVNMSTPLPVRSARLEWTFYFYTYE
jgi:hypothetical protein